MTSSYSTCWHALLYFIISTVLAFMAIYTALYSPSNNTVTSTSAILHSLSINASRALRKSGFHVIATLLQISPELFLSSQNSTITIFAIQDSAITNASLPPWLLRDLLRYHTSPVKLSMEELLKKNQGRCLPTLLPRKKLAITNVDIKERSLEINEVLMSHPDIFLQGPISIHGVLGPFSVVDTHPYDVRQGLDIIQSPLCDSHSILLRESKNAVGWSRIIHLLSSNGFVSFAIGLRSVLDGILEGYEGFRAVTIFAPLEFAYIALPSPILARIVRLHILPQRFTYEELSSFPENALLQTLVPEQDLEITASAGLLQGLTINDVEVVAPDIFLSEKFIIHGISRSIEVIGLFR